MSYEADIARRYARPRKGMGFISVISLISALGVFVGVMATLVVLSVLNGFRTELQDRLLGIHAHVVLVGRGPGGVTDYAALADSLATRPEVLGASPFVYGKGLADGPYGDDGVIVKGVDLSREGRVTDLLDRLDQPHHPLAPRYEDDLPGVFLGSHLASQLGVDQGDEIKIILPFNGTRSPLGFFPPVKRFRVAGILRSGMYEFDATLALIDLEVAQRLFFPKEDDPTAHVTAIQLKIDEPDRAREVGRRLVSELGPLRFSENNWIDLNANLFTWMKLEKAAMFLVTALIVVVASFNIVTTLIMVVMKKQRDIGILATMGATGASIRRIFVTQGLLIGGTGVGAGVVGGWGLSWILDRYRIIQLPEDVYIIASLPVRMEWLDFVVVPAIALLICWFAALYPAWRASRLDPVEAIRYE
jgi:lipoprotein-releasing system permease protein